MDFLNGSFKVGRAFGIDIRVHILFVIWIGFRAFQAGPNWQDELWFLGMLFGIVLLHEFGHCFGARAVGGWANDILMWPLGGLAFAHAPMTPWAQFVTVAAGPAVNVAFCLVTGGMLVAAAGTIEVLSLNPLAPLHYGYLRGSAEWVYYAALLYQVNMFLLAFNLLPIYPLDGGQLFQCLLWPFIGLHAAMRVACQVGLAGCVAVGLWSLSGGRGGMLLIIAIFGGMTCWQRLQQLKFGMIVDERIKQAPYKRWDPAGSRQPWWRRLFGLTRNTRPMSAENNPNAGAWERKVREEADMESEVDRILAKVSREGMHALTDRERRTLERASRERQSRERAGAPD